TITNIKLYHSIFFFTVSPTTEIYTLSLHDALPISAGRGHRALQGAPGRARGRGPAADGCERRRAARALRALGARSAARRAGEPRPGASDAARGAEHPGEVANAEPGRCRVRPPSVGAGLMDPATIKIRRLPDH